MPFYRSYVKPICDFIAALIGLVILLPVLVVVGLSVRRTMGTPVFFRQERPGQGGKPFRMVKFRTMRDAVDARGNPLPDAERLTQFGEFLRRTSLDELPELFNVLRGEMSLVGPRPLLMRYLDRYSPEQARRNEVKPGVTGWAQINGRNAISWEKKFELDVWYVDHCSPWLDFRILLATVWKVIRRDGISSDSHATMSEFMGTASVDRDHIGD